METAVVAYNIEKLAAEEPTFVKQIGGIARSVAKRGDYLFVGMGNTLKVLDVQNPQNPQLVGQIDNLSSPIYEMHLVGDYGIAPSEYQLRIFDLQNPLFPTLATTYTIPSKSIYEVEITGTLAIVAEGRNFDDLNGSGGLRILDISDPLNIQPLALYGDGDSISTIGVYSNTVYVEICKSIAVNVCTGGFGQVDISDPASPTELTFVSDLLGTDLEIYGDYLFRNYPNSGQIEIIDLTLANSPTTLSPSRNELYIGDGKLFGFNFFFGSATIYDLADPLNPVLFDTVTNSGYFGPFDAAAEGGEAYLAYGGKGVQIFDTSSAPVSVIGEYDTFGTPVDAEKVGSYVYLLDRTEDLHILDVADPLNPQEIGLFEHKFFGSQLLLNGNMMIVFGRGGFQILDVANPLMSTERGVYTITNYASPSDMILQDNYAYIGIRTFGEDSLEVVNMADIDNLVMETSIGTPCHTAQNLQMVGDYLYIAENRACSPGDSHIAIVDISDPANATITATYTISDSYSLGKIALIGQHLYVAHQGYGVRILDVSDPLSPVDVGLYTIPDSAGYGFQVNAIDDQLYVSAIMNDESAVQQILDVTNPTMPVQVGEYTYLNGTFVGDYIYYPQGLEGLMIYSNPNPPVGADQKIYLPMILRE